MTSTVTLPVWLVVLAGLLAVIALIDRLLTPTIRWYFRRRVNEAITEVNSRLQLKIRPFGLTKRQVLIDRLSHDPAVVKAVEAHAQEEGMPREAAAAMAARYAREIVPAFNAYAYFRIGTRFARMVSTMLYRVRLGYLDTDALGKVDPEATVVFVMNHRSNMDYVLVTYLASASAALSYAVGEWARIPVLQQLIRSMGAYFIRRNSRNQLYRRVLARYVQMATESGVTQAMFPEGKLSRDGALLPVRLGLLSYIATAYDPKGRDIVFIPAGINYDRVLEDRTLIAEIDGPAPPQPAMRKAFNSWKFLWRNLRLRLAGRWYKFGYACVSFGEPVSMHAFMEARGAATPDQPDDGQRTEMVEALGTLLLSRIADVVPALPVPLVATVLLEAGEAGIGELELKGAVGTKIATLEERGAHVHVPRTSRDYAVEAGLRVLVLRHVATVGDDGLVRIAPGEKRLAEYYAKSIAHLLAGNRRSTRHARK